MTVEEMAKREVITSKEIKSYTVKTREFEDLQIVLQTVQEDFTDKVVWIILDDNYKKEISDKFKRDHSGKGFMRGYFHDGSEFEVKDGCFVMYSKSSNGRMCVLREGQPEIIVFVEKEEQ